MNQVKFWRMERGLSQYELAVASNVPRWAIQLIENGIRNPTSVERFNLASTLGIEELSLFKAIENEI